MLGAGSMQSATAMTPPPGDAEAEAWKRDVIDLLFMAPGIGQSTLPKIEAFKLEPKKMRVDESAPVTRAAEGHSSTAGVTSEIQVEPQDAIVRYVQSETAKP